MYPKEVQRESYNVKLTLSYFPPNYGYIKPISGSLTKLPIHHTNKRPCYKIPVRVSSLNCN